MRLRYTVEITDQAIKDSRRIPEAARRKIKLALRRLSIDPRGPGSRTLKGPFKGYMRYQVGDYRIVYRIVDRSLFVLVIRMGDRKTVYRSLLRLLSTLT